jgi:hypothetical protein
MAYKPSNAGTQAFLTTSNLGGTTLNGLLSDSATTITVVSTADFASSGNIRIEDEIISYTGTTATTFTGCTRGTESSTAASHADTTPVGERYSSSVLDMQGKTQVQTHVLSDVDGDFQVYFLADSGGTDRARTLNVPYSAANGFQLFAAPAFTPYVQYHFSPSTGSTQTDFYFEQKFLETGLTPQVLGVDAFISSAMTTTLGRSIVVGYESVDGTYDNVQITKQGELLTNTLASNKSVSSLYDIQGVTSDTYAILVDLSDTTNFPHGDTGGLCIDAYSITAELASNSVGQIKVGVITRIDGTDADISWLGVAPFTVSATRRFNQSLNVQPGCINCMVTGGNLAGAITSDSSASVTAVNTGITLGSPNGSITPGLGDIIAIFDHTSGSGWDAVVSLLYHSDP